MASAIESRASTWKYSVFMIFLSANWTARSIHGNCLECCTLTLPMSLSTAWDPERTPGRHGTQALRGEWRAGQSVGGSWGKGEDPAREFGAVPRDQDLGRSSHVLEKDLAGLLALSASPRWGCSNSKLASSSLWGTQRRLVRASAGSVPMSHAPIRTGGVGVGGQDVAKVWNVDPPPPDAGDHPGPLVRVPAARRASRWR